MTQPGSELLGHEMHCMPCTGFLDLHLDCDVHPKTRMRRAMNAILFIEPWDISWGGELELWAMQDNELEHVISISPHFNRLVIFETNDESYHGVPHKIRAPTGIYRRSLATYWWEPGEWEVTRPRAKFVALPGQPPSMEKEIWRRERSGY